MSDAQGHVQFLYEKGAAKYIGKSPDTLRRWRNEGVGPKYHETVGGIVYSIDDLNYFLFGTSRPKPRENCEEIVQRLKSSGLGPSTVYTGEPLKRFLSHVGEDYPVKRRIFSRVEGFLAGRDDRLCILEGLRRTGKSVMLLQAAHKVGEEHGYGHVVYIRCKRNVDTIDKVENLLFELQQTGLRYAFVDEVTLCNDFSTTAGVLADTFAKSRMRIVLTGTESLLFRFVEEHELGDRVTTIGTTNIIYPEHKRIHESMGQETDFLHFLQHGGIFTNGEGDKVPDDPETDPTIPRAPQWNMDFRNYSNTQRYCNSAIVDNILHSMAWDRVKSRFNNLADLANRELLGPVIARLVNDYNNRFLLEDINQGFVNAVTQVTASKARHEANSISPVLRKQIARILKSPEYAERFAEDFGIRELTYMGKKYNVTRTQLAEIKTFLGELNLATNIPIRFENEEGFTSPKEPRFAIIQPGLRFQQCGYLIEQLLNDPLFRNAISIATTDEPVVMEDVEFAMKSFILGLLAEDQIIYDVSQILPQDRYSIFKCIGKDHEFDMVIHDKEKHCCSAFEIKTGRNFNTHYYRHLTDEGWCKNVESEFGPIEKRYVLVGGDGEEKSLQNGIIVKNIGEFLCWLEGHPHDVVCGAQGAVEHEAEEDDDDDHASGPRR